MSRVVTFIVDAGIVLALGTMVWAMVTVVENRTCYEAGVRSRAAMICALEREIYCQLSTADLIQLHRDNRVLEDCP